jgi:two-component system, OmpR family, sensor histidine kinase KdpD
MRIFNMATHAIPSRSDPDVLLSAISKRWGKKKGGRLHLFIGMAPGVGKTYAMLLAAKDAQKNGIDVVVGLVETHSRTETEQLLGGLEIIPKKKLYHRDVEFYEMDIDAILERKPAIVLVDELAHTNIPGSRHHKRWQDVFELLDAGIDVYSTINVQHFESRKDSVEKIANIAILETVPDSVLDRAFQIQLIDLSAPDLLRRLKEGKVYLGDKADLAAANFFKEEKLTALREIALRVAAERVDAELQSFATVREAGSAWAVAERLMVAVGFGAEAEKLIRATRRIAYNLDAPWIAVHISRNELQSEQEKTILAKNLELARNLGAEIVTLADTNLVDGLIRIAVQKDVSQIIVGRSNKRWFMDLWGRGSLHEQLIEKGIVDVCVLATQPRKKANPIHKIPQLRLQSTIFSYIRALVYTAVLIASNALFVPFIGYRAVGFLFLVGILGLGLFMPIGSVLFASILTMIGWNFFFIPPIGTFYIKSPEDMFLSLSYLVAALATGILTRRNKHQQEILINRELRSQTLNQILLDIGVKTTAKEICSSVLKTVCLFLDGQSDVILLKKDKSLSPLIGQTLKLENLNREMAVAKWAIDNNKIAGSMTETLSSAEALYIPLKGSFETMGVLAFKSQKAKTLSVEDMDFLYTVAHQIGLSLEKQQFRAMALAKERSVESEKLQQTLLENLTKEVKQRLASSTSSAMLLFIVDNIAIVSRLLAGIFPLKKLPCDLHALVDAAISKVRQVVVDMPVLITFEDDKNSPQVNLEHDVMVQALANIILNSVQYASGQEVMVRLKAGEIIVADKGPGVPEEDLGRIFEKFYHAPDSKGYGLGLAIAKGVIKAHEGKINAKNRPSGGLIITVTLP